MGHSAEKGDQLRSLEREDAGSFQSILEGCMEADIVRAYENNNSRAQEFNEGDEVSKIYPSFSGIDEEDNLDYNNNVLKEEDYLYRKEEFLEFSSDKKWRSRVSMGYPKRMSAIDFIRDVYCIWLGAGLTRDDISKVDPALGNKLAKEICARRAEGLQALPDDLDLPTRHEAEFNAQSESEQQRRLLNRPHQREKQAARRANLRSTQPEP